MPGESKRAAARQRITARRAAEAAARAAEQRRRRTVVGGVVAAIVLVVVLVVVVVVQTHRTSTPANAVAPANTTGNGYVFAVGSAAPVTLDLYEDFQCPNCKALEDSTTSSISGLVAAGTVQVHYHGMAFLNTAANGQYSTRALNAAAVVANAAGADAYKTFHDLLFANQPPEGGSGLTDDQLIGYAAQAGASGEAVDQGIRDLVYGTWVEQAEDQASKDGVTGTPTVLVDGRKLTDLSPDALTAAVTAAQQ